MLVQACGKQIYLNTESIQLPDLSHEYLGGTDIALSLNGVAEWEEQKEDEKEPDGGTDVDLAYLAESSGGTCLGTEDDLRALDGGRNDFVRPVIYR